MKLLSTLALAASALALNPIEVVGNKFYDSKTGERFLMKGVAYQQNTANVTDGASFVDPLADGDACKRDVEYFKKLQTNTLRVYAVSGNQSHDDCMKTFSDAGIYIIADLSEPDLSINRANPEWNVKLFDRYKAVIDDLGKYDNVLGFFAGNEVSNAKNNTKASAFVKAAVRDSKKYIKDNQDKFGRYIPVGYSANDDEDIRVPIADYFACGDLDERADFFGINMYEWCGSTVNFETSGYKDRTEEYANLTIPVFFSEYGCNEGKGPRPFTEVGTIYSDKMTDVWSGGIVYMYFEEENNYGLVSVSNGKVSTLDDFNNLSSQMAKLSSQSYAPVASASSEASNTLACPTIGANWKASSKLPPTPDSETCDCVVKSLECVVDDSVDEKNYGDLFDQVCGADIKACGAINTNAQTGNYGGVSFCSDKDKLSYVLNAYYQNQKKTKDACDWNGSAKIVTPSSDNSCKDKVSAAAQQTANASDTASDSSDSSSGSSKSGSASGSASGSSSSGAKSSSSSTKGSDAGAVKAMGKGELAGLMGLVTAFIGGVSFVIF
ncbi:pH-responsive protein 1 [Diutina rugosa]